MKTNDKTHMNHTPIAMPNDNTQQTYAVLKKIRFFQVLGLVFRIDHLMKNQKLKRKRKKCGDYFVANHCHTKKASNTM